VRPCSACRCHECPACHAARTRTRRTLLRGGGGGRLRHAARAAAAPHCADHQRPHAAIRLPPLRASRCAAAPMRCRSCCPLLPLLAPGRRSGAGARPAGRHGAGWLDLVADAPQAPLPLPLPIAPPPPAGRPGRRAGCRPRCRRTDAPPAAAGADACGCRTARHPAARKARRRAARASGSQQKRRRTGRAEHPSVLSRRARARSPTSRARAAALPRAGDRSASGRRWRRRRRRGPGPEPAAQLHAAAILGLAERRRVRAAPKPCAGGCATPRRGRAGRPLDRHRRPASATPRRVRMQLAGCRPGAVPARRPRRPGARPRADCGLRAAARIRAPTARRRDTRCRTTRCGACGMR
jgi:hypothetical protein